jgi:hypothetical protein
MSSETHNPYPLPPHAIEISQFTERASRAASAAYHGDNPVPLAEAMRGSWYRLDPPETAWADPTQTAILTSGIGHVAMVCEAAAADRGSAKRLYARTTNLGTDVLLDAAQLNLRAPGSNYKQAIEDTSRAQYRLAASANPARKDGSYNAEGVAQLFGLLSARTMNIHARARRSDAETTHADMRRVELMVLHAELADVVGEAVEGLDKLHTIHEQARDARRLTVVGDLTEMAYFTYQLVKWYRNGPSALAGDFVRFALRREDEPDNRGVRPRRGFDVVVGDELIQAKHGSGHDYLKGITHWRANPKITENMDQVVGWFKMIIDNDARQSEINTAWRGLATYFEASYVKSPAYR